MQLSRDFKEFLQSLNDSGVRYLVLGGYAVAFYGIRVTPKTWMCGLKTAAKMPKNL